MRAVEAQEQSAGVGISLPKIEQFFATFDPERRIRRVLDIGCSNVSLLDASGAEAFITARGGAADERWLRELERCDPSAIWLGDLLTQAGLTYVAYDIFPRPRTRLFDLNRDRARETFDLVMNFGTTEHVLNQWNAMKVVHDACRPGGLIWHDLPMAGYLDHGYFNYNPVLFRHLAEANGYRIRRLLMSVHGGASIRDVLAPRYEDWAVEIDTTEDAAGRPIPDAGLLVVLEKGEHAPFRAGLETSTTIGRADAVPAHIAARYGARHKRGRPDVAARAPRQIRPPPEPVPLEQDVIPRLCDAAGAADADAGRSPAAADNVAGPAADPQEKATFVAELLRRLTGEDARDVVAPLARLFAMSADATREDVFAALSEIATPIPGFPFFGERGGEKHFHFLNDACRRSVAAAERGAPPIAVIAMPKTGSAFITRVLAHVFDVPAGAISLRHSRCVPAWARFAARYPIALHDHMPPTPKNVETLRGSGCRKLVVHVRDPRQLVVSMAHHVVRRDFAVGAHGEAYRALYARSGLSGLIDAIIGRELVEVGGWLAGWLEQARRGDLAIKVTTYESLHDDHAAFFESILAFFASGEPSGTTHAIALADAITRARDEQASQTLSNYRKGSTDEWRSVLTPTQARAVAAASGGGFGGLYPDLLEPSPA